MHHYRGMFWTQRWCGPDQHPIHLWTHVRVGCVPELPPLRVTMLQLPGMNVFPQGCSHNLTVNNISHKRAKHRMAALTSDKTSEITVFKGTNRSPRGDMTVKVDRRQQASEIIHWRVYEVVFQINNSAICFDSFSFCHCPTCKSQLLHVTFNICHGIFDTGVRDTFHFTKEFVLFGK